MSQYLTHRTRIVIAAAALTLFGITACTHHTSAPATTRSSAAQATASSPPAPSPAVTYKATTDACGLLDRDRLAAVLGADAGTIVKPLSSRTQTGAFSRCDRQFGTPAARSLVGLQLSIVTTGDAEGLFYGSRSIDKSTYTITPITGLGESAYTFTDPDTGPHLDAYQGNLALTLSINHVTGPAGEPAATSRLLADAARHVLTTAPTA